MGVPNEKALLWRLQVRLEPGPEATVKRRLTRPLILQRLPPENPVGGHAGGPEIPVGFFLENPVGFSENPVGVKLAVYGPVGF